MARAAMNFNRGFKAPSFELKSTDNTLLRLEDLKGDNGTVVVFICNHCPYVVSAIKDLVHEANTLQSEGIELIAICSNDAENYPDDSFDNMQKFAVTHKFSFPYLHDEDQTVAKAYEAECTPDFFGFNKDMELQYRGRLNNKRDNAEFVKRELFDAMKRIKETGLGPDDQRPSIGCSIKWSS